MQINCFATLHILLLLAEVGYYANAVLLFGKVLPAALYNITIEQPNFSTAFESTNPSGEFAHEIVQPDNDNAEIIISAIHLTNNHQRIWPAIHIASLNESFRYEFVFGTNVEKAFLKWTFTNLNEHSDPSVHIHNENGAFLWILLDENDPAHHIIAQGTFHWKATGTMVPENPKLEAVIEQSGRGALKIQLISLDDRCPICSEEYTADDRPWNLKCGHQFHRECLEGYVKYTKSFLNNCPTCRKVFQMNDLQPATLCDFVIENPILSSSSASTNSDDFVEHRYILDCSKTIAKRLDNWQKRVTDTFGLAQIQQWKHKFPLHLLEEKYLPKNEREQMISAMIETENTVKTVLMTQNVQSSLRYFMNANSTWRMQFLNQLNGANEMIPKLVPLPEGKKYFNCAYPSLLKDFGGDGYKAISFLLTGNSELSMELKTKIVEKIQSDLGENGPTLLDMLSDYTNINQHFAAVQNSVTELEIAAAAQTFNVHVFVRTKPSESSEWLWLYFSPDKLFNEQNLTDNRPAIALQHERQPRKIDGYYQAIIDINVIEC